MEITYIRPSNPSQLDPVELSERLSAVVRSAVPWLVTLSNAEASLPEREGKWSTKEVLGHLTDSAVNNLARIVRLQISPEAMQGYAQDAWVQVQHYRQREWSEVLGLWFALNEHMVWTIRHISSTHPRASRSRLRRPGHAGLPDRRLHRPHGASFPCTSPVGSTVFF